MPLEGIPMHSGIGQDWAAVECPLVEVMAPI